MQPDFILIGAMKAATSTLHLQLARQPGIFMTDPKEPCFFSDEDVHAKGEAWYRSLFRDAPAGAIRGESSTHYTKLPDHPLTIERMQQMLGTDVRLLYLMRHPMDRLVSHYVHLWTEGLVSGLIDEAVESHPELVDYGRYAYQLRPYLETFGPEQVLPLFLPRLRSHPQQVLEEVCDFIGYGGRPAWSWEDAVANSAAERLRRSRLREELRNLSVFPALRRVTPQRVVDLYHGRLRLKEPPVVSDSVAVRLQATFDQDLAVLGDWLGLPLSCRDFDDLTRDRPVTWGHDVPRRG